MTYSTIFVVILLSIFLLIVWLWKFNKKFVKLYNNWQPIDKKDWKILLKYFICLISALTSRVFIYLWVVFALAIYFNEINPIKMQTVEVKVKDKEVVFQGMTHIARTEFYVEVEKIISDYSKKWYKVYYEWVNASETSEQEMEKFNQQLSVNISQETYNKLSWLFGWFEEQDYWKILANTKEEDVKNVDLTISEMIKDVPENIENLEASTTEVVAEKSIDKLEKQKDSKLFQYFMIFSLNFVQKLPTDIKAEIIWLNWANKEFFKSKIINARNENLAKEILESEDKKIIVVYWQEHYKGLREILKKEQGFEEKVIKEIQPFY